VILVDTSVWIGHFRSTDLLLLELLANSSVLTHASVIGELACGNLRQRKRILNDFRSLPSAVPATDDEVLEVIEKHKLWGQGIGWIDSHLIASALITNCGLWTLDRKLGHAAARAGAKVFRAN
jgi:predicted nucleic acid-binding protein